MVSSQILKSLSVSVKFYKLSAYLALVSIFCSSCSFHFRRQLLVARLSHRRFANRFPIQDCLHLLQKCVLTLYWSSLLGCRICLCHNRSLLLVAYFRRLSLLWLNLTYLSTIVASPRREALVAKLLCYLMEAGSLTLYYLNLAAPVCFHLPSTMNWLVQYRRNLFVDLHLV